MSEDVIAMVGVWWFQEAEAHIFRDFNPLENSYQLSLLHTFTQEIQTAGKKLILRNQTKLIVKIPSIKSKELFSSHEQDPSFRKLS